MRMILAGVGLCFSNNGDDKSLRRTDRMGVCGDRGAMVAAKPSMIAVEENRGAWQKKKFMVPVLLLLPCSWWYKDDSMGVTR